MFHFHPHEWGIGREDPGEDRERMHRVALHEARIATDHHRGRAEADTASGRLVEVRRSGLRPATASGPVTAANLAACCA